MRKESIEFVVTKIGEPVKFKSASLGILNQYQNILPNYLLEIWQDEGFCQFKNGLYSIVNPNDWQNVVDVWIENTPYQKLGKFYAIGRDGFGKLHIYNPDTKSRIIIDTIFGVISGSIGCQYSDEIAFTSYFIGLNTERLDFTFVDDKPIFDKAVKKLGPLGWYEMYAFEPAYALLGDVAFTLDNLVKVDARVHMMLLRDLIEAPNIWNFNIKEDLKRIGIHL